jgi:intracellular multiplication protein IcmL
MTPTEDIERIRKEVLPKLVRISVLQSIAILVMALILMFMCYALSVQKPIVHAVTESGKIIPLTPLDKPYVGDSRIISFADECIRQAFSHDFKNFRLTLAGAKKCFTNSGASGFDVAIEPLIDDLEKRRMIMSATLEPAVIVKTATIGGVYTWVVQTRMTLFRDGTKERLAPAPYVVDLVIERVPLEDSVRGMGIAQLNVRPG